MSPLISHLYETREIEAVMEAANRMLAGRTVRARRA